MRNILPMLAVVGLLAATGCGSKTADEDVHTVEWYKTHKEERAAKLAQCRSNPGGEGLSPNCVNANRAEQELTWGAKGGIKPIAPLTSDQIQKKP
jgi:hypothetical protein